MASRVHKVRREVRDAAYKITNSLCWYCGGTATTIDHGEPLSKGGSKKKYNLYPSCMLCNNKKGDMSIEEFRGWLSKKGNHNGTRVLVENRFYGEVNRFILPPKPEPQPVIEREWLNNPLAGICKIKFA